MENGMVQHLAVHVSTYNSISPIIYNYAKLMNMFYSSNF